MNVFILGMKILISRIYNLIWKLTHKRQNTKFSKKPFTYWEYGQLISSWRRRENFNINLDLSMFAGKDKVEVVKSVHKWVLKNIKYKKEEKDYWNASHETLQTEGNDCEDQGLLIYAILFKLGFSNEEVGVCVISGHTFAIYMFSNDDFLILDNGFQSYSPIKASEFSWNKGKPLFGFNRIKQWNF